MKNFRLSIVTFLFIVIKIVWSRYPIAKYDKYVGYTGRKITFFKGAFSENPHSLRQLHVYERVAVLIQPGVYLTNFALSRYHLLKVNDDKIFGPTDLKFEEFVVPHSLRISYRDIKMREYYNAVINYDNWFKRIKMDRNYVPIIENSTSNVQLALIIVMPSNSVIYQEEPPLIANEPPENGIICEVVTFGPTLQLDSMLTHAQVQLLSHEECKQELPEYNESLCFKVLYPGNDHCKLFKGGEPLFCNDKLTGIVRGIVCSKNKPRPCASLYDYHNWIKNWSDVLKDRFPSNKLGVNLETSKQFEKETEESIKKPIYTYIINMTLSPH